MVGLFSQVNRKVLTLTCGMFLKWEGTVILIRGSTTHCPAAAKGGRRLRHVVRDHLLLSQSLVASLDELSEDPWASGAWRLTRSHVTRYHFQDIIIMRVNVCLLLYRKHTDTIHCKHRISPCMVSTAQHYTRQLLHASADNKLFMLLSRFTSVCDMVTATLHYTR